MAIPLEFDKVEKSVQTAMTFPNSDSSVAIFTDVSDNVDNELAIRDGERELARFGEPVPVSYWESTAHFKEEWIEQIKLHQRSLLPIQTLERNTNNIRSWFEYNYNKDNPKASTYSCRI